MNHFTPRRRRTALVAAAGIAASALVLASCSGSPAATETPDEPVSLRMTVWTADETQLAQFQEIADAYVAENPELVSDITFETLPFADYTTSLTTQLAGGNAPDLGWIMESYAPEFVQSGALADIGQTLKDAEGYEYDDLLDSSLELWQKDDGLYAYPFSNSPFAIFVNTTQIAAAGQPNPADLAASGDWTYENARDISAATAAVSGKQGLVARDFDFKVWENLSTIWNGWDAEPWPADGASCTFTEPEMVEAMTWIHDAIFVDGAMPGPGVTADFFAGDAAMTITQISRASALDGSFEWDILPLPAGPEGQQNVIGQAGIGVFANAKNPTVAADFLAYFTQPDNAEKLAAFFPPPRESLLNADVLAVANPKLSAEQLQAVVVDGIQGAVTKPTHVNFAKVQDAVRAQLDAMWTADADVEAVLDKTCSTIAPLLKG